MPTITTTHDVAVVGAGPVGSMLAILLAQSGRSVLLLDRHPAAYPGPRAVVFDDEIARVFASAGVPEAMAVSEVAKAYEWRNADGETLLRFDFPPEGPSAWPANSSFDQPTLEKVLAGRVAQLPLITVRRGEEVTNIVQDDDGVTLDSHGVTVKHHTFRARFAVGCDGANSFVRSRMETKVHDLGFFFDWLIVDVVLDEPRVFDPDNLQLCDPARPTTMVSSGPGRRRWEFMRLPDETVEELNDEQTAWRLLAPHDVTPENARLDRHVLYTFQAQWVTHWRDGRLLLAGDAAHLMPPFAGQGMCSGIRDAANLAWKLDAVLGGLSAEPLLDSYTTERSAHVQHAIQTSIALGGVICAVDPQVVAARDQHMIAGGGDPAKVLPPIPPPRLSEGVLLRRDGALAPEAGLLTFQGRVRHAGVTARFDQAVGPGFVIAAVADPTQTLGPQRLDVLRKLGARIVHLVPAGSTGSDKTGSTDGTGVLVVEDLHGSYLSHLEQIGAAAVVVRPDHYLFGNATTLEDLPVVVDDLLDQLFLVEGAAASSTSTQPKGTTL